MLERHERRCELSRPAAARRWWSSDGLWAPSGAATGNCRRGRQGLTQLGVLVERSSAAGVPTRLRLKTPLPSLPAGLEQAAYRIVQEALTNVVKHAPGATAEVEIG